MEKIDLVYILANASKWQNNEIRYSLRSVEKNMEPTGRVYIVGFLPKFAEPREISHIDVQDNYTNKLRNAARKIKAACSTPAVSDRFILMNDDFFITRKMSEIKPWSKGSLKASEARHNTKKGYYYAAIRQTRKFLEEAGIKNPIDFEIHAPIIIDKNKFLEIDKKFNMEESGLLFRSIYGNMTNAKGEPIKDVKIFGKYPFSPEKYKNHKIISTDNKVVLDPGFQRWIKIKFKKISKYEKEKIGVYQAVKMFEYNHKTYNPGEIIMIGEIPKEVAKRNRLKLVKKAY